MKKDRKRGGERGRNNNLKADIPVGISVRIQNLAHSSALH